MSNLFKSIAAVLILFIALEVGFRIAGFQVYEPAKTSMVSKPDQALYYHPKYGLGLNPGQYSVTVNGGLLYQTSHLADSTRITSRLNKNGRAQIHFYGCSFTYGMGVDDESTFPWIVQEACPYWHVKNYAGPGYSTLHGLIQLTDVIEEGVLPKVVVVGYTSYQDARNQLSGIQQKYWSESMVLDSTRGIETAHMPYVKKKGKQIEINYLPFSAMQKRWEFSRSSVVIYRLENAISNIMYGFTAKYELTELILSELNSTCVEHGMKLIVMALNKSESAIKLEKFCSMHHINFLDAAIDINDKRFNLLPFDLHPNEAAHKYYANRLINYMEAKDFCGPTEVQR